MSRAGGALSRGAALALLRDLMSRVFGVAPEAIAEATRAADIERWDSLGMATLSLGLERRLDRRLPIEAFVVATSVRDLVDIICAPAAEDQDD